MSVTIRATVLSGYDCTHSTLTYMYLLCVEHVTCIYINCLVHVYMFITL